MNFFTDEVRRNPYPLYDQVRAASELLESIDQDRWRDALLADLAYEARQTQGQRLESCRILGRCGSHARWNRQNRSRSRVRERF